MEVIQNTSPLGAQKITEELEEMRKVLEKVWGLWEEEEGRLHSLLKSKEAFDQQKRQLEAELEEFRIGLQKLPKEGLEPMAKGATEDELVACWRLYSVSRVWPGHGSPGGTPAMGCRCLGPLCGRGFTLSLQDTHSGFPGSLGVTRVGCLHPFSG